MPAYTVSLFDNPPSLADIDHILQAPANQGITVSFPIIPSIVGKMRLRVTARAAGAADAVQRDLLVEVI